MTSLDRATSPDVETVGPSGEFVSDRTSAKRVMLALRATSYAPIHGIVCDVVEGIATLRGEVPSFFHKQIAQNIARHVPGIRDVVNTLDVRR